MQNKNNIGGLLSHIQHHFATLQRSVHIKDISRLGKIKRPTFINIILRYYIARPISFLISKKYEYITELYLRLAHSLAIPRRIIHFAASLVLHLYWCRTVFFTLPILIKLITLDAIRLIVAGYAWATLYTSMMMMMILCKALEY